MRCPEWVIAFVKRKLPKCHLGDLCISLKVCSLIEQVALCQRKKERPDQRPVLCQLIRLLLLPLRFDMILFVCCLSLLVCVLNLWAYKALDILVEDRPNPKPRVAGAGVVAGVMGTEKLPEMVLLLVCCCGPTAVAVVCGCWVVAAAVVTVELVMKDVSADGALWLGVATVEAAVKVSTFSF